MSITYPSRSEVSGVLSKKLTPTFVGRFLDNRVHGYVHGKRVHSIAVQLQPELTGLGAEALRWACAIHDIADVDTAQEFSDNFSEHVPTEDNLGSILIGFKPDEPSFKLMMAAARGFNEALSKGKFLRPYHHLTGAVFANAMFKEQNILLGRLTATSVLFHSLRDVSIFPDIRVAKALRDADKLERVMSHDLWPGYIQEGKDRYGKLFFDPSISWNVRTGLLGGERPEMQEKICKLDIFQYIMESFMMDTLPANYVLRDSVAEFLKQKNAFVEFLQRVILDAVRKNNDSPEMTKGELQLLAEMLSQAQKLELFSENAELIGEGVNIIQQAALYTEASS
ncbi:MAG: HD domain-containing protein [Candidatus Margulisbacteria bacterium]|nr:HD domain-containing protein [Candidatus Margulisiibacteriota bacterium]